MNIIVNNRDRYVFIGILFKNCVYCYFGIRNILLSLHGLTLTLTFGKYSIFKTSLSVYHSVIENVLVNILFYFNLNAFGLTDHEEHDCINRY